MLSLIPYFVAGLHANPLRYWPVLFLLPAKFAFDDERLVSRLQTVQLYSICTAALYPKSNADRATYISS